MDLTVVKNVLSFYIGIITIIWLLLKLTSCIFMSMFISKTIGFTGWGWWLSSILFFCILGRIVFSKDTIGRYKELIKDFEDKEG